MASDGSLSQDEIDALLAGTEEAETSNWEKSVITVYGHGRVIDKLSFSSYECYSDASSYCDTINSLKLDGNSWVTAKPISENTPYALHAFLPFDFDAFVLSLDDRAFQKVIRLLDSQELAKALKSVSKAVLDKVFRNMSKRAMIMFKEDMEYMGPIRMRDTVDSQYKIVKVIRHLEDTGEIAIDHS